MAQPTTARAGKMRVMLGAPTGADPSPVTVTSLGNTNPARITVASADIVKFQNGMVVVVAGATGTGMTVANGTHQIQNVGVPVNTFELIGVNTSSGTAPQTTGVTVDPPKLIGYTAPCGFNSKTLTLTKNMNEVNIPDCDDPDQVAWVGRDAQSLTAQVQGQGVAAAESVPTWNDAWQNTLSVPVRIEIQFTTGTLAYEGYFQVESLAFAAETGGRVTLNVGMQSDGILNDSWTPAP